MSSSLGVAANPYVREVNGLKFSLEGVTFEDAESIDANCRNYTDKEDLAVCLQQNGVSHFINPPLVLDPTRNDRAGTPLFIGLAPRVGGPTVQSDFSGKCGCDITGMIVMGTLLAIFGYYAISKAKTRF